MSKHQHTPTILIDDRKILLLPFHSQNIPLLFSANVVDLNSSRSASLISGELPAVSAYGCVMVDAILWTSQPNNLYLQRRTTRSVHITLTQYGSTVCIFPLLLVGVLHTIST